MKLTLNGVACAFEADAEATLLDLLREQAGLFAARPGCEIGRCGACMVLLDGVPTNACLVPTWRAEGATIVTAEGLEAPALRAALAAGNAFQCGYCAPGITITLAALLRETPRPDEQTLRAALVPHLCRCTGYHSIVRAVLAWTDERLKQPPF